MKREIKVAEDAGRDAARSGSSAATCPHRDDEAGWLLRQAWQRGYREELDTQRRRELVRALYP